MLNCIDIQMVELIKDNKVTIQIKHNGIWHEITREDFVGIKSITKELKRIENGIDH